MLIFKATCILFFLPLFVQLIIWRVRLPKNQLRALLIIFLTSLVIWIIWAFLFSIPAPFALHVAFAHLSLSLGYIAFYAAIEVDSPTLTLVHFIAKSGSKGISYESAASYLGQRPFFNTRFTGLIASGLIQEREGKFFVVGKGSVAFRLILAFRKLYGPIPKGG